MSIAKLCKSYLNLPSKIDELDQSADCGEQVIKRK